MSPTPTLATVPIAVAAELVGVSVDLVEDLIASGQLRAERIGRKRFVNLDRLEALARDAAATTHHNHIAGDAAGGRD